MSFAPESQERQCQRHHESSPARAAGMLSWVGHQASFIVSGFLQTFAFPQTHRPTNYRLQSPRMIQPLPLEWYVLASRAMTLPRSFVLSELRRRASELLAAFLRELASWLLFKLANWTSLVTEPGRKKLPKEAKALCIELLAKIRHLHQRSLLRLMPHRRAAFSGSGSGICSGGRGVGGSDLCLRCDRALLSGSDLCLRSDCARLSSSDLCLRVDSALLAASLALLSELATCDWRSLIKLACEVTTACWRSKDVFAAID